jgi:hypothetical protein
VIEVCFCFRENEVKALAMTVYFDESHHMVMLGLLHKLDVPLFEKGLRFWCVDLFSDKITANVFLHLLSLASDGFVINAYHKLAVPLMQLERNNLTVGTLRLSDLFLIAEREHDSLVVLYEVFGHVRNSKMSNIRVEVSRKRVEIFRVFRGVLTGPLFQRIPCEGVRFSCPVFEKRIVYLLIRKANDQERMLDIDKQPENDKIPRASTISASYDCGCVRFCIVVARKDLRMFLTKGTRA